MDEASSSPLGGMEVEGVVFDADMVEADGVEGDIDLFDADNPPQTIDDADMTFAEDEVEMAEEANRGFGRERASYEDEVIDEPLSEPPGFRSPPRVQTRDDGHQIQAMGHTSRVRDDGEREILDSRGVEATQGSNGPSAVPITNTPGATNGRSRSPSNDGRDQSQSGGKTLATQHQDNGGGDDRFTKEQEQTLEDQSSSVKRLTQFQRQDAGDGNMAEQVNEVTVRAEDGDSGVVEIETIQRNSQSTTNDESVLVQQINTVNVRTRGDDCASRTASGAVLRRPIPAKHLLSEVGFDSTISRYFDHVGARFSPGSNVTSNLKGEADEGPAAELRELRAPPVQLTFEDTTYDLFCAAEQVLEPQEGCSRRDVEAKPELFFGIGGDHAIYFQTLETLCAKLRELFPDIEANNEELVMIFGELGISVPEDNVYTREISLYDLDRLHVGANLPGRLHITLEKQPRLIHRFNVLAEYVSQIVADNTSDADETDDYADAQQDSEDPTQDFDGFPDPRPEDDNGEEAEAEAEAVEVELNPNGDDALAHEDPAPEDARVDNIHESADEAKPRADVGTEEEGRPVVGGRGIDGGTGEYKTVMPESAEEVVNYEEDDSASVQAALDQGASPYYDLDGPASDIREGAQRSAEPTLDPAAEELIDYDEPLPEELSNKAQDDRAASDDGARPGGTVASAVSSASPDPGLGPVTRSRKRSQEEHVEVSSLGADINQQAGLKKARVV